MINEHIKEAMDEVLDASESLEEGSDDWRHMTYALAALGVAQTYVNRVNTRQLARLLNGDD